MAGIFGQPRFLQGLRLPGGVRRRARLQTPQTNSGTNSRANADFRLSKFRDPRTSQKFARKLSFKRQLFCTETPLILFVLHPWMRTRNLPLCGNPIPRYGNIRIFGPRSHVDSGHQQPLLRLIGRSPSHSLQLMNRPSRGPGVNRQGPKVGIYERAECTMPSRRFLEISLSGLLYQNAIQIGEL